MELLVLNTRTMTSMRPSRLRRLPPCSQETRAGTTPPRMPRGPSQQPTTHRSNSPQRPRRNPEVRPTAKTVRRPSSARPGGGYARSPVSARYSRPLTPPERVCGTETCSTQPKRSAPTLRHRPLLPLSRVAAAPGSTARSSPRWRACARRALRHRRWMRSPAQRPLSHGHAAPANGACPRDHRRRRPSGAGAAAKTRTTRRPSQPRQRAHRETTTLKAAIALAPPRHPPASAVAHFQNRSPTNERRCAVRAGGPEDVGNSRGLRTASQLVSTSDVRLSARPPG